MRLSSLQAGGAEEGRSFPKAACAGTSLFRLSSLYGSFPGGMAAQVPGFPSIKRLHSPRSFKSALRRRFFLNEALLPAFFYRHPCRAEDVFPAQEKGLQVFLRQGMLAR